MFDPTFPIRDIKVGRRFRKDMGDIKSLAARIADTGLINPVTLNANHDLIAGARRLEAYKLLGRHTVPVVVLMNMTDVRRMMEAERDENECRKPLTPEEALAQSKAIAETIRPIAKARQESTQLHQKNGAPPFSEKTAFPANPTVLPSGQDRAPVNVAVEAAKMTGYSRMSLERVEKVVKAAEENPALRPIVDKMNQTGNVSAALRQLEEARRAIATPPNGQKVAPATQNAPQRTPEAQETILRDMEGVILTDPRAIAVFTAGRDRFRAAIRAANELGRLVHEIMGEHHVDHQTGKLVWTVGMQPCGEALDVERKRIEEAIESIKTCLRAHEPHAVCDRGHAQGETCHYCHTGGWISKQAHKSMPTLEERRRLGTAQ
jgi:ParB-like chromosome segregation protein Spo0J